MYSAFPITIFFLGVVWAVIRTRDLERHRRSALVRRLSDFPSSLSCPVSFQRKTLRPCTSSAQCASCAEDAHKLPDSPLRRTCVDVDQDYVYRTGNVTLSVPDGRWCLPPRSVEAPMCRTKVLTQEKRRNAPGWVPRWRCLCPRPDLVGLDASTGTCTKVEACQPGGKLVCPASGADCVPGTEWTPDWDPALGVCRCPRGSAFHRETKTCQTDVCWPGRTVPDVSRTEGWKCRCPASHLETMGKCVKDPCHVRGGHTPLRSVTPDDFGMKKVKCVCRRKGTVPVRNPTSFTGWSCYHPCDTRINPCGNRGRCVYTEKGPKCVQCRYPNYASSDGLCNNKVKKAGTLCQKDKECESQMCRPACTLKGFGWEVRPTCCDNESNVTRK